MDTSCRCRPRLRCGFPRFVSRLSACGPGGRPPSFTLSIAFVLLSDVSVRCLLEARGHVGGGAPQQADGDGEKGADKLQ